MQVVYLIERAFTECFAEFLSQSCFPLDTHPSKATVYVDTRAGNKTARILAAKQDGSTDEFVSIAKAIHRCLAHDLWNSFRGKNFSVLFSWEKAGA